MYVLAAPSSPAVADDIRPEIVARALDLLMQRFRYVVIDTAAGIDENALTGLDRSTDIVLLSATDIAAVRATQKTIEALTLLGLEDRRWHFVLNRANARVGLTQDEIEAALGLETSAAIPSTRAVPVSFNDGAPLAATDPRSPVTRAITAFAASFVAAGDQSGRRRRWALSR
jgi:pilus assembly protein CpaE